VVEVTRLVEVAPTATEAATPAPSSAAPRVVDDTDQVQEQGGVVVTLKGAGLLDWASVRESPDMAELADAEAFQDATVLGALTVSVANNTQAKVNVYPEQGTVVVGAEQVELTGFMFFSENVGGTLFPGVVSEGTLVFALKATPWEQVADGTQLLYEIGAPADEEYTRLGEAYQFQLELMPE